MATGVVQNVGDAVTPVSAPGDTLVDPHGIGVGLQAIGQAVNIFQGLADRKLVANYNSEASEVGKQAADYKSYQSKVLDGMYNAQDKETATRYSDELTKLRNGEVQGVLSPSQAQLKLQSLTKSYINRFPHLGDTFKGMLSAQSGFIPKDSSEGSSGSSGDLDPQAKGRNELIQKATEAGITPYEYIQAARKKKENDAFKEQIEHEEAIGKGSINTIYQIYDKTTQVGIDASWDQIRKIGSGGQTGGINADKMALQLGQARDIAIAGVQRSADDYAAKTGGILPDSLRSDLYNRTKDQYDKMIEIVKGEDSQANAVKRAEQYLQLRKDHADMQVGQILGPMWDLSAGDPKTRGAIVSDLFQIADQSKSALALSRRAAADQPDRNGQYSDPIYTFLRNMDHGSMANFLSPYVAKARAGDDVPKTNSPQADAVISAATLNLGMMPSRSPEERQNMVGAVIKRDEFEGLNSRKDATDYIKTVPDLVNKVKERTAISLDQQAERMKPEELRAIFQVGNNPSQPVQLSGEHDLKDPQGLSTDPTMAAKGYMPPDDLSSEQHILKARFNQNYQLVSKVAGPAEADKWLTETFKKIIGDRAATAASGKDETPTEPHGELKSLTPGTYRDEKGKFWRVGEDGGKPSLLK